MISLEEFSKILAIAGNFSSQIEHILTAVKSLPTSPKDKEEPKEEIEVFLMEEEINDFGEQSCDLEIKEEKMLCDLHEEDNKEEYHPIETWFQTINRSHCSLFLPLLFISYYSNQLVLHTLMNLNAYFSNYQSMKVFLHLLHT